MGILHPTVLVGLGEFGGRVVGRVQQTLEATGERLDAVTCEAGRVREHLAPILERLLRAGRATGDTAQPRLDVLVFAAALQVGEGELAVASAQVADLLADGYGAIFPADRPPEQRTAALHLVVASPALAATPAAGHALARIEAVERWVASARHPVLARIWLAAQQTTGGTLTVDELVASCAYFALATVGSGLRTEDAIGQRMAHPAPGEGRLGFFAVATADLPEAELRAWAAERAVYDGLRVLVDRVERQVPVPDAAAAAVAALAPANWLAPLVDGEPARRCLGLATRLSGGTQAPLPEIRVRPFDSAEDLRVRYHELLQPAVRPRAVTNRDVEDHHEAMEALDRAEHEAVERVQQGLDQLLGKTLDPKTGLARLPEVEAGLKKLVGDLRDDEARDLAGDRDSAGAVGDPHRAEVEEALLQLPSSWLVRAVGGAVGLAAGFLATLLSLDQTVPPPATGPAPVLAAPALQPGAAAPAAGAGIPWDQVVPWLVGLAVAGLAGFGWAYLTGWHARRRVREALVARRTALLALWQSGGGGNAALEAREQLRLRRRRARRGAILAIEAFLGRLRAVRRALISARDASRQELERLGVPPGADGRQDDLSAILRSATSLHRHLVGERAIHDWIAGALRWSDPNVWATELLEGSWPARGLDGDIPCADPAVLAALGREQVEPLAERNVLAEGPARAEAREVVAGLARRVPTALALPCVPRDPYDQPARGVRAGETLVVATRTTAEVLPDGAGPVLVSPSRSGRVMFLRTWEGYSLAEVARGAGLAPTRAAAGGSR